MTFQLRFMQKLKELMKANMIKDGLLNITENHLTIFLII